MKTIYYKSLDELPIWNWDMVHKEKDYSYICKKGKPDGRAQAMYKKLSYTFDKLDLPLLRAKRDIAVKVIGLLKDILANSKDARKIDEAVTILSAVAVSGEHSEWLSYKFLETPDQKQLMSLLLMEVKRAEQLKKNFEGHAQTLSEKVVAIERILNVTINPKECSVNLFMEYEKQAVETARQFTK